MRSLRGAVWFSKLKKPGWGLGQFQKEIDPNPLIKGLTHEIREALDGPLAQLVEQQTLNLRVEGSIPSRLILYVA